MQQGFQQFLQKWYLTSRGQRLFKQESRLIQTAISKLFGYYFIQLGLSANYDWIDSSRVSYKIILDDQIDPLTWTACQSAFKANAVDSDTPPKTEQAKLKVQCIKADFNYLPLRKDSVDVMLLPHTLEAVSDPHYLLRQVDISLVAEGHLVLTGFNPWACVILKSKFGKDATHFRNAKLVRSSRVIEWLTVLGYDIEQVTFSSISCFSVTGEGTGKGGNLLNGWRLLERTEQLLSRVGLRFGSVYCIVARKRIDSPKLVGATWKRPSWVSSLGKGSRVVSNQNSKKINRSTSKNNEE